MPSCSNCAKRGFSSCEVSPLESSRCDRCVHSNRSACDVLGATPSQFQNIVSQHSRLESELEEALERVARLQQQKKLWRQRMTRAISRGISNLEELDKVEAEEQAQAIAGTTATNVEQAESISGVDWSLPSDFALDPGLLADLGIPGSVETSRDTRSGS